MDAVNRIFRTIAQVLGGAGGTAIIALVFTRLPTAVVGLIFAGLTTLIAILHNVVPTLSFFQKLFPAKDQHYFVDVESVVGDLADIAGELSQHLSTQKAAAIQSAKSAVEQAIAEAAPPTPVPDVAGGDVTANPNVLHRETTPPAA